MDVNHRIQLIRPRFYDQNPIRDHEYHECLFVSRLSYAIKATGPIQCPFYDNIFWQN